MQELGLTEEWVIGVLRFQINNAFWMKSGMVRSMTKVRQLWLEALFAHGELHGLSI